MQLHGAGANLRLRDLNLHHLPSSYAPAFIFSNGLRRHARPDPVSNRIQLQSFREPVNECNVPRSSAEQPVYRSLWCRTLGPLDETVLSLVLTCAADSVATENIRLQGLPFRITPNCKLSTKTFPVVLRILDFQQSRKPQLFGHVPQP